MCCNRKLPFQKQYFVRLPHGANTVSISSIVHVFLLALKKNYQRKTYLTKKTSWEFNAGQFISNYSIIFLCPVRSFTDWFAISSAFIDEDRFWINGVIIAKLSPLHNYSNMITTYMWKTTWWPGYFKRGSNIESFDKILHSLLCSEFRRLYIVAMNVPNLFNFIYVYMWPFAISLLHWVLLFPA